MGRGQFDAGVNGLTGKFQIEYTSLTGKCTTFGLLDRTLSAHCTACFLNIFHVYFFFLFSEMFYLWRERPHLQGVPLKEAAAGHRNSAQGLCCS